MYDYREFGQRVERAIEDSRSLYEEMVADCDLAAAYDGDDPFLWGECGWDEHVNFLPSSETDWDNADARQRGEENPHAAWVLTDRDVWHPNPYYQGPPMPHPELEIYEDEDIEAWRKGKEAREARAKMTNEELKAFWAEAMDDDIPF